MYAKVSSILEKGQANRISTFNINVNKLYWALPPPRIFLPSCLHYCDFQGNFSRGWVTRVSRANNQRSPASNKHICCVWYSFTFVRSNMPTVQLSTRGAKYIWQIMVLLLVATSLRVYKTVANLNCLTRSPREISLFGKTKLLGDSTGATLLDPLLDRTQNAVRGTFYFSSDTLLNIQIPHTT